MEKDKELKDAKILMYRIREGEPWENLNWSEQALKAFDVVDKALGYRIAKDVKKDGCSEKTHYKCPSCERILTTFWKGQRLNAEQFSRTLAYCPYCGQKLNWKGELDVGCNHT